MNEPKISFSRSRSPTASCVAMSLLIYVCGQQKGLPFWEALRFLVRLRGAAQPPEREAGPGIGAGRMIGRSAKAIGNDARDRPGPGQPATAKLVRLHKGIGTYT
jgi:hypothetical protein